MKDDVCGYLISDGYLKWIQIILTVDFHQRLLKVESDLCVMVSGSIIVTPDQSEPDIQSAALLKSEEE